MTASTPDDLTVAEHAPIPSRTRTASGRGRLATWLMGMILLGWAAWACLILSTPLHPSNVAALLQAEQRHAVSTWAVVTSDSSPSARFAPALVDPVSQRFQTTSIPIGTGTLDGENVTSVLQTSEQPQIAWRDDRGVHVTHDFSTDGWVFSHGSTAPTGGTSSALAYRGLVTDHAESEAGTIRDLWGFGSITPSRDSHLFVFGSITLVSFFVGLGALLGRRPRFRTRWSWFWLFGCPLGIGMVWFVLREGWFGHEPAPAERVGGFRGFVVFVATSVVLGAVVQAIVFRGA